VCGGGGSKASGTVTSAFFVLLKQSGAHSAMVRTGKALWFCRKPVSCSLSDCTLAPAPRPCGRVCTFGVWGVLLRHVWGSFEGFAALSLLKPLHKQHSTNSSPIFKALLGLVCMLADSRCATSTRLVMPWCCGEGGAMLQESGPPTRGQHHAQQLGIFGIIQDCGCGLRCLCLLCPTAATFWLAATNIRAHS
jgi:hypothetical protein